MYRKRIHGRSQLAGLAALIVAGVAALGAYAFTQSATVPAQKAAAGNQTIGTYTVSSPTSYTFSADGTQVVGVAFTLDAAASDVQVALVTTPTQSDWTDCGASTGGGNAVSCDLSSTPVAVADATKLSVAAVSSGSVVIHS